MKKIYKSLKSLSAYINTIKKKKIGLCHGCFDIVHWGHILHFESAKKNCDFLIVSITADKYVNKGVNRPIFNENERAILLKGIEYIDAIYINKKKHSGTILKIIRPHLYFKGKEYKSKKQKINKNFFLEQKIAKNNNVKIFFTNDKTSSTTMAIEKLYNYSASNKN
jgi:cytidyltransferase-like protein